MILQARNACTPERKKQCKADNGPWLEAVCARCPYRDTTPSQYLEDLCWLRSLHQAGYPLPPDDLDLSVWEDLGLLEFELAKNPKV